MLSNREVRIRINLTAAPSEATFLLLMIYLPPRAQRTQRMEKFRDLLKIDPLIKPQISLCALCALCGKISSGNCCQPKHIHLFLT